MCKSVDNSGDIPFLSTVLSFNMTELLTYKLVQDSTYLEVNGTYFKTKYIVTSLFPKYILSDSSTVSYVDTLSTHMVRLHNSYSSFGALSQNVYSKSACGDKLTTSCWSLIISNMSPCGWGGTRSLNTQNMYELCSWYWGPNLGVFIPILILLRSSLWLNTDNYLPSVNQQIDSNIIKIINNVWS